MASLEAVSISTHQDSKKDWNKNYRFVGLISIIFDYYCHAELILGGGGSLGSNWRRDDCVTSNNVKDIPTAVINQMNSTCAAALGLGEVREGAVGKDETDLLDLSPNSWRAL